MGSLPNKVEIVGCYRGIRSWVIARFPLSPVDAAGHYRIGTVMGDGAVVFAERGYQSREDAEAHLIYDLDSSIKL